MTTRANIPAAQEDAAARAAYTTARDAYVDARSTAAG